MESVEKELEAAHQTIDALCEELALTNARINSFTPNAWRWIERYVRFSARNRVRLQNLLSRAPAGVTADSTTSPTQNGDAATKLIQLANREFQHGRNESAAAVARMVVPSCAESERILSLVGPWERGDGPPPHQRGHYHLALAEAHRILGNDESAAEGYKTALTFIADLGDAHSGLANLRMPGDNYLTWLDRLYQFLKPKSVIEIGVSQSASLARVPPPALAIGIDPVPSVLYPLQTEARIYPETSDYFFKHRRREDWLGDEPLSIGFIDGLHVFEQALRDFMHLEAYCGPRSIILFHDTVPLDEITQRRTPVTHYSTGDVWKAILCLKYFRPDLDIFTIAAAPTGLTVVTGLDPESRVLEEVYDEAVARFIDIPFSTVEDSLETALNIVPNDWAVVQARLQAQGIA